MIMKHGCSETEDSFMKFVYLNMDEGRICASEETLIEELTRSCRGEGPLPNMEAITNIAQTETLIVAGHLPFDRMEALVVYRSVQMLIPITRTGH